MHTRTILIMAVVAAAMWVTSSAPAAEPVPVRDGAEVATLTPEQAASAREQVAQQMIAQGRDPAMAHELANQLTDEDLIVLADNPRMMQEAGEANAQMTSLLIAGLVIGGLVALLIFADNGFVVQT